MKAIERGVDQLYNYIAERLQRIRELRRLLVHEYATATAEQVHECAVLVAAEFVPFYDAYRDWIGRGFSVTSASG